MKVLRTTLLILSTFFFLHHLPIIKAHAESTPPFAPFSVEGNPPEDYHFEELFPLLKYIRPRALKIFENRDRSRNYDPYMLCDGGDERDYVCAVDNETGEEIDHCNGSYEEGGPVAICNRFTGAFVKSAESSPNNSCTAHADPNKTGISKGKCSYKKRPGISNTVKGTDFSAEKPLFPKLQSESLAFTNVGSSNSITWGSTHLSTDFCELTIKKLVVVKRAKQTKATLSETGEWPLGWVDWGYQVGIDQDLDPDTPTVGTKTLLEIEQELPDGISAGTQGIVDQLDNMYINFGNFDLLKGLGETKAAVCKDVSLETSKKEPAQWYIDLMSAPIYPPSFRQGYIRPSICIWNICCPRNPQKCIIPEELLVGIRKGLYYDTSISQAYNAAIDQLFVTYPLEEARQIFKDLIVTNPLIRFASTASIKATPTRIHQKLYEELKDTCLKYVPWSAWPYFTQWIDYLDPDKFLGPNNTCPNYVLAPEMTKDKGGAYPEINASWLLNLVVNGWGEGDKIDEVELVKYHLITVPEPMGQSLKEIQQGYYDTRDTLAELEDIKDFNDDLSSTIDDEKDLLYIGKNMGPATSRRYLGLYGCTDPMFSAQRETSIEQYATGVHVGCFETTTSDSATAADKCDPTLFSKILEDSKWKTAPANVTSIIQGSAMFEGGELNPKLEEVYAKVSKETGVPCEVLAGHHFEEATTAFTGSRTPEKFSVANGGPVGEQGGLEATALSAANGLLRHPIGTTSQLITAISNFNGGGNSNCQAGFPANIPYNGCPREFIGADDPYAVNLLDGKRTNMYLLYCGDFTPCLPPKPYGNDRPGVFPTALVVHDYLLSRATSTPTTPSSSSAPGRIPGTNPGGSTPVFYPETCGEGSLGTALGCLPYTKDAFVSTLLSFIAGISGGIALIIMLISTIQIMTSAGDAKKLSAAKELFMSALAGLLFLIFAVSILRIIAGDIIKLPGF